MRRPGRGGGRGAGGGARAVRGAGPGARLGREWRGRIRGPAARVRGSASSAPAAGRRRPARDDTRGRGCVLGGTHPTRGGVGSRPPWPRTRPPHKVTGGERRVLLLRAARRSARPGVGRGPPAPHRPSLRRRQPRGHAASARAAPRPLPRSAAGPWLVRSGPVRGRRARRARPRPGRPPALQGRRAAAGLGPHPGGRPVCSYISSRCRKSRIFQGFPLGKPGENWDNQGCPGRHGRGPPAGATNTAPGAYGTFAGRYTPCPP